MVITTTQITQMHVIVKMLQDGPESVKEGFFGAKACAVVEEPGACRALSSRGAGAAQAA